MRGSVGNGSESESDPFPTDDFHGLLIKTWTRGQACTCLPKVTEIFHKDVGELLIIDHLFLVKVQEQSKAIWGAFHSFQVLFKRLEWTLVSSFQYDWALGTKWVSLMERAERPFSPVALKCWTHDQGCPMGYPYGSVKIFPRSKLHIRMQIKIMQNLAIH